MALQLKNEGTIIERNSCHEYIYTACYMYAKERDRGKELRCDIEYECAMQASILMPIYAG